MTAPTKDTAVLLCVVALAGVFLLIALLRAAHLHSDCEAVGEGFNGMPIYRCGDGGGL